MALILQLWWTGSKATWNLVLSTCRMAYRSIDLERELNMNSTSCESVTWSERRTTRLPTSNHVVLTQTKSAYGAESV